MEDFEQWFPQRLQQLCLERNLSQYELAKRSDVSGATISRILSGKTLPSLLVLHRLCQGLEITESDFYKEKKTKAQAEFDRRLLRAIHDLPTEQQKNHLAYLEFTAHIYNSSY